MRHSLLRAFLKNYRPFVSSSSNPLTGTISGNSFSPLLASSIRKMSSEVPSPVLKKPLKMALIQLASGKDKKANLEHAAEKVKEAAGTGAKLCVLPECFNSPYGTIAPTLTP